MEVGMAFTFWLLKKKKLFIMKQKYTYREQ